MDNRQSLQKLSQNFSREDLTLFLRAASGKFKPEKADYTHFVRPATEVATTIKDLQKLGWIEFEDSRRLIVLAGEVDQELTSQSGKLHQYEIAKQVLKNENFDAGIFVFHDEAGHFRFSWITAQYTGTKREFSSFRRYTYFVSPEQSARTFVEQIGKADFSSIEKISEAFSVEPVTKDFFKAYRRIFEEAEATIKLKWTDEKKRLYTQRFFNRVMFLAFLERKGWLVFDSRKDYLKALFADYHENTKDKNANFHRSRLNTLFFWGLNNPRGDERNSPEFKELKRKIGDVPYLNGGLFDQEADDEEYFFPDTVVAKILSELVYQFNFTVTESTPLDVEVAVDPEMLGRIFEELVTGRHESGSYYTPKPVVAFMCREALKGYLGTAMPSESAEALALFVDKNDAQDLKNPELALNALRTVKVCDPACGSGAYLLGMLHELLEQRECLFVTRSLDARNVYDRKLEIIQNNLYGVDKDDFAVNIARLRLWLSLIVDYEGETPPPLPNLDFKIETGDSLTAPDPSGGLQPDMFRYGQVQEFLTLKNEFMDLHAGSDKKKELGEQIDELKKQIEDWAHPKGYDKSSDSFDWQVDFAEVFAPELVQNTLSGKMTGIVNAAGGQIEMTEAPKEGGFDVVLANPPYVRQELLGDYKELLKPIYSEVYRGTADLYVFFYARAYQLLKNGGMLAFISSNKYFRSKYGEKLRTHLATKMCLSYLIDFGDSPIFEAIAYPSIIVAQKALPKQNEFNALSWQLNSAMEQFEEALTAQTFRMYQSDLRTDGWRLEKRSVLNLLEKLRHAGKSLTEYVDGDIYRGVVTGLNKAFIVDKLTHDRLIAEHPSSAKLLKPFLRGRDVKRWQLDYQDLYLIFTRRGTDINKYPAILKYLKNYKSQLTPGIKGGRKPGSYEWYEIQDNTAYWQEFEKPKIVWGNLTVKPNFTFAEPGFYISAPANLIASDSKYLLGILNSKITEFWVSQSGAERQGGFLEYKPMYISPIPIPAQPEKEKISSLVAQILDAKQSDSKEDVSALEHEIDQLVYSLYRLTREEIAIVEGKNEAS